jgi:hypothetical protein
MFVVPPVFSMTSHSITERAIPIATITIKQTFVTIAPPNANNLLSKFLFDIPFQKYNKKK